MTAARLDHPPVCTKATQIYVPSLEARAGTIATSDGEFLSSVHHDRNRDQPSLNEILSSAVRGKGRTHLCARHIKQQPTCGQQTLRPPSGRSSEKIDRAANIPESTDVVGVQAGATRDTSVMHERANLRTIEVNTRLC
jgi:hypothetical protein